MVLDLIEAEINPPRPCTIETDFVLVNQITSVLFKLGGSLESFHISFHLDIYMVNKNLASSDAREK